LPRAWSMPKYSRWFNRTRRLLSKSKPADYLLVAEALPLLIISRILILFFSFRTIIALFGYINKETSGNNQYAAKELRSRKIGTILRVLSDYLPWRSMCLEQARAGFMILKLHRKDGTIYFGLMRSQSGLKAHAWLRSGTHIVTGAENHAEFTTVFTVATTPANSDNVLNHYQPIVSKSKPPHSDQLGRLS